MLGRLGLVLWVGSAIDNVSIAVRGTQPDLNGAITMLMMWLLGAALFVFCGTK